MCPHLQNSNVGGYNTRGFVEVLAASQSNQVGGLMHPRAVWAVSAAAAIIIGQQQWRVFTSHVSEHVLRPWNDVMVAHVGRRRHPTGCVGTAWNECAGLLICSDQVQLANTLLLNLMHTARPPPHGLLPPLLPPTRCRTRTGSRALLMLCASTCGSSMRLCVTAWRTSSSCRVRQFVGWMGG